MAQINLLTIGIFLLLISLSYSIFQITRKYILNNKQTKKPKEPEDLEFINFYNHAPCGYHSIDVNGYFVSINQTELDWLGYQREELIGRKKFSEILAPEYKAAFESKFSDFLNNKASSNLEFELLRKDGTNFMVRLNANSVTNEQGEFLYSRSILVDITDSKRNDNRLEYLNSIIQQSSDAIFSADANMVIKSWNKGAENMYGYTATEVIDKTGTEFMQAILNRDMIDEIVQQVCENGHWQGELSQRRKDGTFIDVLSSLTPIRQPNGELSGYVSINQDITSQKLYETQLKQFNKELSLKVLEKTDHIKQTLERMTDGFIAFDREWRFSMLNKQAEEMLGISSADLLGKIIWDVFPGVENHPLFKADILAMETQKNVEVEEYFEPLNKWFYKSIYPSRDGVTIIIKDRTDVRNAELLRAYSEHKYKLLFENNPLPMWMVVWPTTKILDVNESAIKKYGYSREEFLQFGTIDLLTPEDRERLLKCVDKPIGDVKNPGTWKHSKKDGSLIDVEIITHEIHLENQVALLVLANDVTEKVIAEEALLHSNNQLRKLSAHLEKIREEERTFIAREIHDELGQQLTGLKMDISWLTKKMQPSDPSLKAKANDVMHLIDETVRTVRRIATELRPGILDDLGLIAALQWQSQEFSKRTGIQCNFSTELVDQKYNQDLATGIFRIFQESLTNVARHASAAKVQSSLSLEESSLVLVIKDDGIGFKDTERQQLPNLGLIGMRERATSLKGHLTISSEPGIGTTVKLTTPFDIE